MCCSSNAGNGRPGKFDLPLELWEKVFTYLPIEERKNIHLVCHLFYDACNSFSLRRSEQFAFYGCPEPENYSANDGACFESLSGSRRSVWNLNLYMFYQRFPQSSVQAFFMNANVESLILRDCRIPVGFFRTIVELCENLHTFVLRESSQDYMGVLDPISIDLGELRSRAVVHQKLTDFTLDCPYSFDLENKRFLDFFIIFPNIKRLALLLDVGFGGFHNGFNKFSTISSDINSGTEFTFSCIYYQLSKMRHQLEKLRLDVSNFSPQNISRLSHIEMVNLKELDLELGIIPRADAPNMNLKLFKHVTDLLCCINEYEADFSEYILLIFNNLPELRFITLYSLDLHEPINFTEDCFKTLVRSKLESLKLYCAAGRIAFNYSSLENDLSPNCQLKHLALEIKDCRIALAFATYCHSLEILNLRVTEINDDTLQTIFKNLKKLLKLTILNRKSNISNADRKLQFCVKKRGQVYHPLDCLTHLSLMNYGCMDLARCLLKNLVFPNLKSLVIDYYDSNQTLKSLSLVWQKIQTLTKLEYLFVKYTMWFSFSQCLALCSNLPKLRYLILMGISSKRFNDYEFHQLFQTNSSLRMVVLVKYKLYGVKCYKDKVTNIVHVKDMYVEDWDLNGRTDFVTEVLKGIPSHYNYRR